MSIGLVGRKSGMTRVFTEAGLSVPVTVVEVAPNRVTQIKTLETDGYSAVQVTTGVRKASRVSKSLAGHFAKAGTEAGTGLWEFRAEVSELAEIATGAELTVERFAPGQMVDVTGTSKGKGFQGTIKRHNFHMQDATHGNSRSHRVPGSIGQCQTPGRVWKGKKMAGHMGDARVTTQSLEIVQVDVANNLLLVKGALPGATGSNVIVRPSVKHPVSKG
jgi:large subunit ribosomal protein L3